MSPISTTETLTENVSAKEYLLHFVGSKTYGARRFIAESKKIGVQRAVPFSMLKASVKFGDVILCAEYKPKEERCEICMGYQDKSHCPGCDGKGTIKTPVASVFGYFTVTALTYSLPEEVREKLVASLDIVETIGSDVAPPSEQRACGSYYMGPSIIVNDDIPQIATKIQDAFRGTGLQAITGGKYFLRGAFTALEAPLILEGCRFIRGYQKVRAPLDPTNGETPKKAVAALYDYTKRSYMKKADAEAYDRALEGEHQADLKDYAEGSQ